METLITDYLSKLEFGELQSFKNMGVIPLLTSINGSPKYLTLKEALEKKLLNVKEVDEGGSVPHLKVINKAKISVLLLDGEELVGAKTEQSRQYHHPFEERIRNCHSRQLHRAGTMVIRLRRICRLRHRSFPPDEDGKGSFCQCLT